MLNFIEPQEFMPFNQKECCYCDKQNCINFGFETLFLSNELYQKMINTGWTRCGIYLYKPLQQISCCMSFNTRLDTREYLTIKKKNHRKIAKRCMEFLDWPQLTNKNKTIDQLVEEFIAQQKENKKEEGVPDPKEKKKFKQNQFNIEKNKIGEDINDVLTQVMDLIKKQKQQFLLLFKEYFATEDIQEIVECFICDDINFKISKSTVPKKGDYYSNFIMQLYGQNKQKLFSKLSLPQFINYTKSWFTHCLNSFPQYLVNIAENGYISFFLQTNAKSYAKIINKQTKKHEKLTQKNQMQKELPKFILDETFQPNSFQIANMKVIVKKVSCEKNASDIYQRYQKVIHKKDEIEEEYQICWCQDPLNKESIKSPVDNQTFLVKGCYHMNYYINDKLIAQGVIDILDKGYSSAYQFYEPCLHDLNFGIFSALVEIEYVKRMNKLFPDFYYYYMGFYIQSTKKMAYKKDFQPQQLLCPETYQWVHFDKKLRIKIDKLIKEDDPQKRYVRLTSDETKVIDDMNLDKINKIQFFIQNARFSKNKIFLDLSEDDQKLILPYLDNMLQSMGKEAFNHITLFL